MLFLTFELGDNRYALEAARVVEVLPRLPLNSLPHAPAGVAGVFQYRGGFVPVIDLSALLLGRPAPARLSTRILLVNCPFDSGQNRMLGLIAERATGTIRREAGDFAEVDLAGGAAAFLGPVLNDEGGFVQWIDPRKLLPQALREAVFKPVVQEDSACP